MTAFEQGNIHIWTTLLGIRCIVGGGGGEKKEEKGVCELKEGGSRTCHYHECISKVENRQVLCGRTRGGNERERKKR